MATGDLTFRSHIGIMMRIHIMAQSERMTVLSLALHPISPIDAGGPISSCGRPASTWMLPRRLILKKFVCSHLSPPQRQSLQHHKIAGVQNHSQDMVIHHLTNLPRLFLDTPRNILRRCTRYIHRLHGLCTRLLFCLLHLKSRILSHILCIMEEMLIHHDSLKIFCIVTSRLRP